MSVPGFCDDYAHLAYGLLELYETDFDPAWLEAARRLMELLDELFLDPAIGRLFLRGPGPGGPPGARQEHL